MGIDASRIFMLLGYGAGVRWMDGGIRVDKGCVPLAKANQPHTMEVIESLAQKIIGAKIECDYIVAFEDRPATVVLAQLLAVRLGTHWGRRIPTLIVGRRKNLSIFFRYYIPPRPGSGRRVKVVELKSYRDKRARRLLFRRRRVLVFASALANTKKDATMRLLQVVSILRLNLKIVGLAACGILNQGTRVRVRQLVGLRKIPILFLRHFGRPEEPAGTDERLTDKIAAALRKMRSRKPRT